VANVDDTDTNYFLGDGVSTSRVFNASNLIHLEDYYPYGEKLRSSGKVVWVILLQLNSSAICQHLYSMHHMGYYLNLTAVPYANISAAPDITIDVAKRIVITASAPRSTA